MKMMTNTVCRLFYFYFIISEFYVQVDLLQVAHVWSCSLVASSRVGCFLKSPVQVKYLCWHIALYRTIVYCGMMGSTTESSLRVTSIGVRG